MTLIKLGDLLVTNKDLITTIITILGACGGLIGLVKSLPALKAYRREKEINNFKERHLQISTKQGNSTLENFNYYINSKKYRDLLIDSDGLIIDKNWELYQKMLNSNYEKEEKLVLLNDAISITNLSNITEEERKKLNKQIPTPKYPRIKIIPKKKYTYSEAINNYNIAGGNFFNGDLFAASNIQVNDQKKLHIDIYQTNYYGFYDTCKALELMYLTKQKKQKLRKNILNLKNRYAGIGISCLTIFKNVIGDNTNRYKNYFLYHQRNSSVMESKNKIHVAPAGSFQPITSKISHHHDPLEKEFNEKPISTVYREFCEELLHTNHMDELVSISLLQNSSDYRFLEKFGKVYYLGIGLEPYNTKVELLTTMVIDFNDLRKYVEENQNSDDLYVKKLIRRCNKYLNFDPQKLTASERDSESQLTNIVNNIHAASYLGKKNTNTDEHVEGDIHIEKFTKEMLLQLAASINVTPSAREIFSRAYVFFDELSK